MLAEFKLNDCQARRQRRCLLQLAQQQRQLVSDGVVDAPPDLMKTRKEIRKQLPRLSSKKTRKDLDYLSSIPMAGGSLSSAAGPSSRLSKFLTVSAMPSTGSSKSAGSGGGKSPILPASSLATAAPSSPLIYASVSAKSPQVLLHSVKLAIMDNNQDRAIHLLLTQLPAGLLKKKRPFEANQLFLLALGRGMEQLALVLVDRCSFPPASLVNSPIFTMKPTPKNQHNIPFHINASLFPSYFICAVSMGYERLVKYMIVKLGASLNQTWYGLTPLHIALYSLPIANEKRFNMISTLLEFGADPWIGIYAEQLDSLSKLKDSFGSACTSAIDQKDGTKKSVGGLLNILEMPQRPVLRYMKRNSNDALVADTNAPLDPVKSSISELYSSWKREKYILPVNFAVALADRDSTLLILQRMSQLKPRKHTMPFANSSSTSLATSSNISLNADKQQSRQQRSASTTSLGKVISSSPQKDTISLLIQQDLETTIFLLKSGVVDLYQTDPKGANALHLAARSGNSELVQILLHFDAADNTLLNSRGEHGWTALHEAISKTHLEVFRLLMKKGADETITNEFGDTPLELGQKLGISPNDLDQVWLGTKINTLRRSSNKLSHGKKLSKLSDSTSTILPGTDSSELLAHLDCRIMQLLNAPLFERKKKSNLLLDLAGAPLLWKQSTTSTTSIPSNPSTSSQISVTNVSAPAASSSDAKSPSIAASLLDYAPSSKQGSGKKESNSGGGIFSKILKKKSKNKSNPAITISEASPPTHTPADSK